MLHKKNQESLHELRKKLEIFLSNTIVLQSNYRYFHWNIRGSDFFEYHKHFQSMYEMLGITLDDSAERIRMLGGLPKSDLSFHIQNSTLKAYPNQEDFVNVQESVSFLSHQLSNVADDLKVLMKMAGEIQDETSVDFFVGILRELEKTDYFYKNILGQIK
jgi:starvation-inducible DNA-binding protein